MYKKNYTRTEYTHTEGNTSNVPKNSMVIFNEISSVILYIEKRTQTKYTHLYTHTKPL